MIGGYKNLPQARFYHAAVKGSLCAGKCRFCIIVVQEILCGKDIGMHGVSHCLSIGGKLGEEAVIVFFFFRACEEIVKEIAGACIVAPEYREIVLHRSVLSAS